MNFAMGIISFNTLDHMHILYTKSILNIIKIVKVLIVNISKYACTISDVAH